MYITGRFHSICRSVFSNKFAQKESLVIVSQNNNHCRHVGVEMYSIRKQVFKFPKLLNRIDALRKKAYTNDDNPGKYHVN